MFEGMSAEAVAALVREPVHAGGRAGFWGLDSAAPLVAGTYVAARAAVDVALTTVGPRPGRRAAPPTACAGRPAITRRARCTAATASSTTPRSRPRRSSRATGERVAILDVDYHHGNGTQQIFWRRGDVRYVSIHADPDGDYPYFLGRADETGEGDGAGENLNIPLRGRGDQRRTTCGAVDRALEAIARRAGLGRRRLARLRHLRARSDRRLRADDRASITRSAAGRRRSGDGWSSSRRAATTGRRSARTPGRGCAARRGAPFDPLPALGSASAARSPAERGRDRQRASSSPRRVSRPPSPS